MPLLHSPFRGPGTNIPPEPGELLPPAFDPQIVTLGPAGNSLPVQYGLDTTHITFTRPDGAVLTSDDIAIGKGYVFGSPDSTVVFTFAPGVLNQGGDWQYSIFDPTVMTQPATGTFHVPGPGPHPDPTKPIPDASPLEQQQKKIANHKIVALDDSSSIYTSESPSTFYETPPGTLGDEWSDMTIPVNDGSNDLIALWNLDVYVLQNPTPEPDVFDGFRGGVLIMFPGQNDPSVLPMLSYTAAPIDGGQTWTQAWSGAISTNGTLLACIAYCGFTDVPNMYPRISRDFGQTWADVTGLPASLGSQQGSQATPGAQQWTKACFSQNAQVMYIHRSGDYIYKSTDSGVTWNALTNGPKFPATHGNPAPDSDTVAIRLRCSQDGSVIAGIDWGGQFYVSTNGGTNWSHTDFYVLSGSVSLIDSWNTFERNADFGMPIDGSKFLVNIGLQPAASAIWSSIDGANWIDRTIKPPSATSSTTSSDSKSAATHCFVSPNGENTVVMYQKTNNDQGTLPTDASYAGPWHTDRGSWVQQPITINLDTGGRIVAANIVPI